MLTPSLSEEQAFQLGVEAYIYGYPLILMNVTKDISTAVPARQGMKAPINQFAHASAFPDASFTDVVSPNADTLYSVAWLDLLHEPIILSVPDTDGRYYLMPMLDAWTNVFAAPGKRTTGTGRADFAIVGPEWMGEIPAGVQTIQAPTCMVWLLGRTQTNGKADYDAVRAIQAQYRLTPLSHWGKPYTPPTDMPVNPMVNAQVSPVEQVKAMNAANFFGWMCHLMKTNPPAVADADTVKNFAPIGIVPGQEFEIRSLDDAVVRGLERSLTVGYDQVVAAGNSPNAQMKNNWLMMYDLGTYGTNYLSRAGVAWVGLGANLAQDAIYPMTRVDRDGNLLSGNHRYVIHFDSDQLPPIHAFWSITLYNSRQCFVDNPLNRYAIGDRDPLIVNSDGSLDLYIQTESPGAEKEPNWLPSPEDSFNLIMRLYWPKPAVLDGSWSPPPITRVT
jgi:hypothetical protein